MVAVLFRLAAAVILVAVGAWAALAGWAASAAREDPGRVLETWPTHVPSLMQVVGQHSALADTAPETRLGDIHALMQAAPLYDGAFVAAGQVHHALGNEETSITAFNAALRRQPRNVLALSHLVAERTGAADYATAATFLSALMRLRGDPEGLYSAMLAAMAETEEGLEVLEARLAQADPLALAALRHLNRTTSRLDLLLRLNANEPSASGVLVRRLQSELGIEAAFTVWMSLLPAAALNGFSWPQDPAFLGTEAPSPFTWSVSGGAQIEPQGGLYASQPGSGRGPTLFARQTVLLAPGDYTLTARMDGDATPGGSAFSWQVRCHSGGDLLGETIIDQLTSSLTDHIVPFTVPAGACAGQDISFAGRPGLSPIRARTNVRLVTIRPE